MNKVQSKLAKIIFNASASSSYSKAELIATSSLPSHLLYACPFTINCAYPLSYSLESSDDIPLSSSIESLSSSSVLVSSSSVEVSSSVSSSSSPSDNNLLVVVSSSSVDVSSSSESESSPESAEYSYKSEHSFTDCANTNCAPSSWNVYPSNVMVYSNPSSPSELVTNSKEKSKFAPFTSLQLIVNVVSDVSETVQFASFKSTEVPSTSV
mmetsp:Transcript_44571/g.39807  ORF Transcript_44571/g.39807 Transcript_44571/m.39807 type:complete len:210 (+) Transcript_44571:318-947(+)